MELQIQDTGTLIRELEDACRRPLLVEVVTRYGGGQSQHRKKASSQPAESAVSEAETASVTSSNYPYKGKRSRRVKETSDDDHPSWEQLLLEASRLAPIMNDEEHGRVCYLASILLLGFLLTQSTGNEYFLLQNAPSDQRDFDPVFYVLHMSLEERLQKSLHYCSAQEYGEFDSLNDESVEFVFESFLNNGLGPFLAARPFHRGNVDILHLIAMVIHPNPSEKLIDVAKFEKHPTWQRTRKLMATLYAVNFSVNYNHRIRFAQLVADSLTLPPLRPNEPELTSPLLYGALPHLRASLRAFARNALCPRDAHVGHCALVVISYQTEHVPTMREDWDYLLHQMVEDHSDYRCSCHSFASSRSEKSLVSEEKQFCGHSARGKLLAQFILQACPWRKIMPNPFYEHTVTSLADAIEWQVENWIVRDEDDEMDVHEKSLHSPCLLASLLDAVSQCFHFLATPDNVSEDDPYDSLIRAAINLLLHSDQRITHTAKRLLVNVFREVSTTVASQYVKLLYNTLRALMKDIKQPDEWSSLIASISERSSAFALTLIKHLIDERSSANRSFDSWLSIIALNNAQAAYVVRDQISKLLEVEEITDGMYLLSAALSLRQAELFEKEQVDVLAFTAEGANPWSSYLLARHALLTGNFAFASSLYRKLQGAIVSEDYYVWMLALDGVATAEANLLKNGAFGLPFSTETLRSALGYFEAFDAMSEYCIYSFQKNFLELRLNSLDLMISARQLIREMRLTGSGPSQNTRPRKILHNIIKGFKVLAFRYQTLQRNNGLHFQCGRSIRSLSLLQALALFISRAIQECFADFLRFKSESPPLAPFLHESSHPLAKVITELDRLIVKPMDTSLDLTIRAAAMIELLDGLLLVPIPIPADFLIPREIPRVSLEYSTDPWDCNQSSCLTLDVVEGSPTVGFSFRVWGHLPKTFYTRARVNFSTMLLWYTLDYTRPLIEDEQVGEENQNETSSQIALPKDIRNRLPKVHSPVLTRLSPQGSFLFTVECPPIIDEGWFQIKMKLGCRDIRNTEWEIPLSASEENKTTIPVRISRSR